MRTELADVWDKLRTSLWFVPALMAASSAVLAFVMIRAQSWIPNAWMSRTPWLATGDPDGARQILATIAGSVITVTGVIFSVTLVALSLASQQFGPRLLRTFMRDRGNQIVLGTFIGTFIYCMLVLRVIEGHEDEVNIPDLAVSFGVVLALAALAVLIYFIHHVVSSIQAETLIRHVSNELHETMRLLYPITHDEPVDMPQQQWQLPEKSRHVRTVKAGYVRAIDVDGLLETAEQHDCVISITQRPGRFVIEDEIIAQVHADAVLRSDALDQMDHQIRKCVLIGPARTAEQDIEFSIAQLVEIAVRSLSPSLNDPFTAMACLDRLGEAIVHLGRRQLPKTAQHHSEGNLRLLIDRPDFRGMVDLAFDQIRQNARDKVAVVIRMLELIATVLDCLRDRPVCFEPLLRQARMIAGAAEDAVPEANDRADIAKRYKQILAQADEHSGNGQCVQGALNED